MRWKLGIWIGPPKVLVAPKPTSSVRINRTLGAPTGASTPFGKSGVESLRVRPIFPAKGGSGFGKTLGVWDAAGRGSAVDTSADAATREVEPSRRRRLISTLPKGDRALDFLSDLSSLIVFSRLCGRWGIARNASKADVARGRVHRFRMARGGAVAAAIVRR